MQNKVIEAERVEQALCILHDWLPNQLEDARLQVAAFRNDNFISDVRRYFPKSGKDSDARGPAPTWLLERGELWLAAIQRLSTAVDDVKSLWQPLGPSFEKKPNERVWRVFARDLYEEFAKVMEAENPGKKPPALALDGPTVKYVTAVVPLITGETPTRVAVWGCLNKKIVKSNSE